MSMKIIHVINHFDIGQHKTIAENWGKQFTVSRMVSEYEKAYLDYLNSSTKNYGVLTV